MHLELPGRDDRRQVIAEDAQVLAYRGRAAPGEWLPPAEVQVLLAAGHQATSRQIEATDFAERAVAALSRPWHIRRASPTFSLKRLREDHIRVREASGQHARRQIAVRAQKPADILGVYVYLPAAGGTAS